MLVEQPLASARDASYWANAVYRTIWATSGLLTIIIVNKTLRMIQSQVPRSCPACQVIRGVVLLLGTKLCVIKCLLRFIEDLIILGHIGQEMDTSLRLIVASVNLSAMHCS